MQTAESDYFRIIKSELWTFAGRDALRFLNGVSTPHLSRTVSDGAHLCGRGLFLDPKGKTLAPFIFLKLSETEILLRLDIGSHSDAASRHELNQSLFDHLSGLIIADELTITRESKDVLQCWGTDFEKYAPSKPLEATRPQAEDLLFVAGVYHDAHCLPAPHLGLGGHELWPFAQVLPSVSGAELSREHREDRFMAARYLEFPNEFKVGDLPLELGFADAISFFKGCYRGQEIIARVTYRGKLVRALCELHFAKHLHVNDTQLENSAGQLVGEIRSLNSDANSALAVLRFDAGDDITTVIDKVKVTGVKRLVKEVNERFR